MARMLEAEAHLPPLGSRHSMVSGCNSDVAGYGDCDDDDDDDDSDEEDDDDRDDDDSQGGKDPLCPDPTCRRKKPFKGRQDLIRHYTTRTSPTSPMQVSC
jgi:hypothetical protein